ncbi:Peptidoglycan N-acetylglucosamine deacetylase [Candidatus Rhodobacter oscarellae]|uniref:Chitooligosaccharide deacetylase n=1 Tax=Candidatus Rhodobacter oscarellae TaxID=1675527 RepID=A0A0J9E5G8_9RHOB|nr:polysaccharide deacetylase family protein [Candidatus Rhodobacter lobularis]KMW58015.1 Peptidoglycan N-acetylglucosamine deacetylase [Candidatus Rhodobacter lobularis]
MLPQSRRTFLASGAAALAFAPRAAQAAYEIKLPPDLLRGEPATITAVRTKIPHVAMTYDDGPHPTLTPILLDELKKRRLRATFNLIGRSVVTWPDIVRRIADEGHEIGNHTWTHPNLARHGDASVLREIDRTTEAIFKVTGRPPVTFRPPYGSFTLRQRKMLWKARGMPTVLWSVDPLDWKRPGSSVVRRRIVANSVPGSIILSHDIHSPTVRAMPGTFDGLIERGLQFGSLSQLMGWPLWQMREFKRVAGVVKPTGKPDLIALQ